MDPAFTTIIKTIIINKWRANSDDIYRSIFHALFQRIFELLLAYNGSIILKEHQTVLPEMLQAIKITHRVEQGIVKTTALREKISGSELCSSSYMAFLRIAIPSKSSCPLLRDNPSECSFFIQFYGQISANFLHILNEKKKTLVFTDEYSRHVIADIFASISMRIGRTSNGGSTLKLIQCL